MTIGGFRINCGWSLTNSNFEGLFGQGFDVVAQPFLFSDVEFDGAFQAGEAVHVNLSPLSTKGVSIAVHHLDIHDDVW